MSETTKADVPIEDPTKVWDRLDEVIDFYAERGQDIGVELEIATRCMWSGTLRWTPEPNRSDMKPDRSLVLHAAGGTWAEDVLWRLLEGTREH